MKNDAILLPQYERYGVLKRKDFVQCFIDEMDIDLSLVSRYNEWLAEQGDAGCLAVYYLSGDSWKLEWLSVEDTDFDLNPADLPKIKTDGKLPFKEWLKNENGFSYHQWEDLLDGSIQGEEIEEEYQRYLYDDLPKFIRKYL